MLSPDSSARYDIIVVGAGNAALTAALSASQSGANVLVVEKAPQAERGGNSRFSGGLFRFAYEGVSDLRRVLPGVPDDEWKGIEAPPYDGGLFEDDIMRVTLGQADKGLTNTLIQKSLPTILWMTEMGMQWQWSVLWRNEEEGRLRFSPGAILEAKNKGVGLVAQLFSMVDKAGIRIAYGAKVTGLVQDGAGAVTGVRVRAGGSTEEIPAKAVILASGGFEANTEMRARYLGPGWDRVKVRGSRFNTGETLQLALDIGAKPYGHWQGCHSTPIDAGSPDVGDLRLTDRTNRLSYPFGIMVNALGERFVDEGAEIGSYTYAKYGRIILTQPGSVAYQIFDAKTVHLLEERYETGTPVVADSIAEVALGIGVPERTLTSTVQRFNDGVRPGEFNPAAKDGLATEGVDPPKSNWALPLDTPPFTVYPVTGGITFTFGGLQINGQASVLDTEDVPIPGLYATGEITGGFFYENYPGGTGLMRGAVYGRIAGAEAARLAG